MDIQSMNQYREPAMGRRAGHSDWSAAESHSRLAEMPMSSVSCCSHVKRGLPWGHHQVMSGRKLRRCFWIAMWIWRTLWAGVSGGSRRMWPNNACRLWLIILSTSVRLLDLFVQKYQRWWRSQTSGSPVYDAGSADDGRTEASAGQNATSNHDIVL